MSTRDGYRSITLWSAILIGLTVLHNLDHVRQGRTLPSELYVVGALSLIAPIVVLVLAMKQNPLARPLGAALGVITVVGLLAIHVAPTWWALSDSFGEAGVDAISWIAITVMMIGAAGLAVVSWTSPVEARSS